MVGGAAVGAATSTTTAITLAVLVRGGLGGRRRGGIRLLFLVRVGQMTRVPRALVFHLKIVHPFGEGVVEVGVVVDGGPIFVDDGLPHGVVAAVEDGVTIGHRELDRFHVRFVDLIGRRPHVIIVDSQRVEGDTIERFVRQMLGNDFRTNDAWRHGTGALLALDVVGTGNHCFDLGTRWVLLQIHIQGTVIPGGGDAFRGAHAVATGDQGVGLIYLRG